MDQKRFLRNSHEPIELYVQFDMGNSLMYIKELIIQVDQ